MRRELVAQADVGKGPAHHDFVIAAARTVGVEVYRLHAMVDEVLARGAVGLDRSGGRDVIRGYAVAEIAEHARAGDVLHGSGLRRHVLEVRRILYVRRLLVPDEVLAFRDLQSAPALVALEDIAVALLEEIAGDVLAYDLVDLFRGRPDVFEVDGLTLAVMDVAERLLVDVNIDASGEGVSDDQRRRHQVVRPHFRVDAALEVAIAAEHRRDDEIFLRDDVGNFLR